MAMQQTPELGEAQPVVEDVTVYDDDWRPHETPPEAATRPPPDRAEAEGSAEQIASRSSGDSSPAPSEDTAALRPPRSTAETLSSAGPQPPPAAPYAAREDPEAPPRGPLPRRERGVEAQLPSGLILMPRYVVYIQGGLFLLVAVVAFAAGYFIGRGDASVEMQAVEQESQRQRVLVEGRVVYNPGTGNLAPDEGAVVIVLPDDALPERKIPVQGLRPQDPPPRESLESLSTIEALGGGFVRADETGTFSLVLPQQGRYWVLIVSRHASRAPGQRIETVDYDLLDRIFLLPEHLIGSRKYFWELRDLELGMEPVSHNFGRDGAP